MPFYLKIKTFNFLIFTILFGGVIGKNNSSLKTINTSSEILISFFDTTETESEDSIYHPNVPENFVKLFPEPDSLNQGLESLITPTVNMLAEIRHDSFSMVKISFSNYNLISNPFLLDEDSNIYNANFIFDGDNIFILNLELDAYYWLLNYDDMVLAEISTHNKHKEPIYLSDNFIDVIEVWQEIELQELPNDTLDVYIASQPQLDVFEIIYFFQRFYGNEIQKLPPGVFFNIIENKPWDGSGEIPVRRVDLFGPNPNPNIDPCICNYVLRTITKTYPGTPKSSWVDRKYNNHSRVYYGSGSNVYHHMEQWGNGPAKRIRAKLNVKRGATDKTENFDDYMRTDYTNEIFINFLCDKNYLGTTVPEKCLCEKQVHFDWRYDVKLSIEPTLIGCWCNERKSEMTLEDGTVVYYIKRAVGKKNTPLALKLTQAKGSCGGNGNLQYVKNVTDLALKTGVAISNPEWSNITAAGMSLYNVGNIDYEKCGPESYQRLPSKGAATVSLKANESIRFVMDSEYAIGSRAKRSAQVNGEIVSNYFMTTQIDFNHTQTELDYCCMKKVGLYDLHAYGNSNRDLSETKKDAGYVFFLTYGIYPYTWDYPSWVGYSSLLYDGVAFENHRIFGNNNCNDVPVYSTMVGPKEKLNENVMQVYKGNSENIIVANFDNPTTDLNQNNVKKDYEIKLFDMSGRVLYESKINQYANTPISFPLPINSNLSNQVLILTINNYETIKYAKIIF